MPVHTGTQFDFISAHKSVTETHLYNYQQAQIPVPSDLNIIAWEHLSQISSLSDYSLVPQLKYGFPVPFHSDISDLPSVPCRNHPSAYKFASHVDKYITKEVSLGALTSGFHTNPLSSPITLNPLQTVEKKGSDTRRTVVDLSFGDISVNSGIAKDSFPDYDLPLIYPSIDVLTEQMVQLGRTALLFKADGRRYYRQLPTCPSSYALTAVSWRDLIFVDQRLAFGLSSSAKCAQRTSNAIAHFYHYENPDSLVSPFLDDFGSVNLPDVAMPRFQAFKDLCARLGVELVDESEGKTVPPAPSMVYLGLLLDAPSLTISIPQEKIDRAMQELEHWSSKTTCTKRELQSLLGKLFHLATCLPSARVFTCPCSIYCVKQHSQCS